MNVKNWSFFSSEDSSKEGKREVKEHILNTVCLWGAIGLLWCSFVSMIGERFPDFLQGNPQKSGMDWWVIILFVVVLWLGYEWPEKYLKKLVLPCRLVGIVIPVAYVLVNLPKIVDGFMRLIEIYLPFVNSYYKTSFVMALTNSGENAAIAFTALSMILWWILWMLANGFKNRVLLVLFPVCALILELAVGLSPLGNGLVYLLFGGVILAIMGGSSVLSKAVVLVCVGASLLLSNLLFEEDIQKLVSKETKRSVLNWQKNLSLEDMNPLNLLQMDFHFNWEQLNNSSPQYTGKVVLEIESNTRPTSTVYLKGFYGTNYENGNWTYDDSAFKAACREVGKSEEEVAQSIFQMPYEVLSAYQEEHESDDILYTDTLYGITQKTKNILDFRILYTGTTGNVAYVPYFSDYTSMDEDYNWMGDYLLKKSVWDRTIEGNRLNADIGYYWVNIATDDVNFTDEESEWRNALADAYLQIPEDMTFISKAVEESTGEGFGFIGYLDGGYFDRIENENYRRILYADVITAYLQSQMSYSQELDNLPRGTDPMEYALTISHEGYCMHFASIATMMLREVGVPARYVSGYAVSSSNFKYDLEKDIFRAEVGDYMAHAWVEIYLDDIGWIPVEATPGGSLDSLPTDEEIKGWERASKLHKQQIQDMEPEVEPETQTEDDVTSEDDTEVDTEVQTESQDTEQDTEQETETEGTTDKKGTSSGDGTMWNGVLQALKVLGILGTMIAAVFAGYRGIRHWMNTYEEALTRDIQKNRTRKVVKRINRRLYHILRVSKGRNWFMSRWSDEEYKAALIEGFTNVTEEEWNRYMNIVKKNHYSCEEITTEEMHDCYDCYKRAVAFNKNLTMPWHNKK